MATSLRRREARKSIRGQRALAPVLIAAFVCGLGCAAPYPTTLLRDGERAYYEGRTGDAELIWLEALADSEAYGDDDPRLAQSLRMLANLQIHQGRYAEAQPNLERWLLIADRRGETRDYRYADALDALAGVEVMQGNLARAVTLYERSVEVRENSSGAGGSSLAQTLENLGRTYDATGRLAEAEASLTRAVEIREASLVRNHPSLSASLHTLAAFQQARGRYAEAYPIFERALAIARSSRTRDARSHATLLWQAGSVARAVGANAEALESLEKARKLRTKLLGERDIETAVVVNEIALVHAQQGKLDEAAQRLAWVLEIRTAAFGQDSAPVAATLNNIALVQRYAQRHDDARETLEKALTLLDGRRNRLAAAIHTNLGVLDRLQGKPQQSEEQLRLALDVQQQVLEGDHPEIGTTLHSLAESLLMQGDAEEAAIQLERARAIKERAFGPEHYEVANTGALLGVVHAVRNHYALAERDLGQAIAIWEKAPSHDPLPLAVALVDLAQVHRAQGRPTEAADLYERAIPIFEAQLGANHPTTLRVRQNAAAARAARNGGGDAIQRHQAMLEAARRVLPPGDPKLAQPLLALATAQLERGRCEDAGPKFAEVVALLEKQASREPRALAFAIGRRADCLVHQRRHAEAAPLYRRAIALLEADSRPPNPREFSNLTGNLASVHALLGQWDLALAAYEQSLELRDAMLPGDDPELAETLDGLAVLLVRQRDYARAERLLQRAMGIHESADRVNPVAFGHTLSSLGLLYASQNHMDAAEPTLLRALDLLEPALGSADPLVLETRREYDLVVRARRLGAKKVEGL